MSKKSWYLKRCDLFSRLSATQIQRVESQCQIQEFAVKSPVYLSSNAADDVLLLGEGRVKISHFTATGKETILTFIEPGELFGQRAIFGESCREEHAEAMEHSVVVRIPASEIRRLMREDPDVSLGVAELIALRLQRIERRHAELMFLSNRRRLIHLLLELAQRYGRPCSTGTELDIRLSHDDLGKLIGCTRETVSLTLAQLQNEGSVWRARQRIVVTDIERLAKSVQFSVPSPDDNRAAFRETARQQ